MKIKKYKPILWVTVMKSTTPFDLCTCLGLNPQGNNKVKGNIWCSVCQRNVARVTGNYWYSYFTVADQRHLDSKRHQANLLLKKLSGYDESE